MRVFDRDLIREHYGQRSCEPHLKGEHMAAPTDAATSDITRLLLPRVLSSICEEITPPTGSSDRLGCSTGSRDRTNEEARQSQRRTRQGRIRG